MKNIVSNIVLLAAMFGWALGVEFAPVMKVMGWPMLLLAFMLWRRWSNIAKRLINE